MLLTTVCGNQQCELDEACPSTTDDTTNATSQCCPADCPVAVHRCAIDGATGLVCSGHGSCLTGVGACWCFDGYTGDACDSCASPYVRVPGPGHPLSAGNDSDSAGGPASCVLLPGRLSTCSNGVRDGREVGVDCGGVCHTCTTTGGTTASNGTSTGSVSLSVAGEGSGPVLGLTATVGVSTGAGCLLLVGIGVAVLLVRRRRALSQGTDSDVELRRISAVSTTSVCVRPLEPVVDPGTKSAAGSRRSTRTGGGRGSDRHGSGRDQQSDSERRASGHGVNLSRKASQEVAASRVMPWGTPVTAASSRSTPKVVNVQPVSLSADSGNQ